MANGTYTGPDGNSVGFQKPQDLSFGQGFQEGFEEEGGNIVGGVKDTAKSYYKWGLKYWNASPDQRQKMRSDAEESLTEKAQAAKDAATGAVGVGKHIRDGNQSNESAEEKKQEEVLLTTMHQSMVQMRQQFQQDADKGGQNYAIGKLTGRGTADLTAALALKATGKVIGKGVTSKLTGGKKGGRVLGKKGNKKSICRCKGRRK